MKQKWKVGILRNPPIVLLVFVHLSWISEKADSMARKVEYWDGGNADGMNAPVGSTVNLQTEGSRHQERT